MSQRYSAVLKAKHQFEMKTELIPDFCVPIKYKDNSAQK